MNPLFKKQTNDDQDPIILPQDDNEQGDMLDPATQRVAPPPPVAPAEDEKVVEPSRMAAQKDAAAHTPWDVYLRGKWINRVFTVPNMTADDVKRGLVDHDGLNPTIEVRSGQGRNVPGSVPLNRIGSNPLLEKESAGAPFGEGYGNQNCYKCKQPIKQGEAVSWEGGMESHVSCPPAQGSAQEQSRIMFPKGQQPKKPQMGPTQPQTPQRAPNKPQYASVEKVATRRKIVSGFVPATSWGVPQEYAHRVARTLANAGMRDFDVATDETLHVAYFSFGNEAEMEVSADIVCEFYRPEISASKGRWIGWQCRPERQPGVPDVNMPLSKMNSKRAGSQGTRDAVAKLRTLGIKTTADLDKWIKEHPKTETKGPYAGSRSLMSRYDALNELVGNDAATWILHDLATDAAAKELPRKRGFFSPEDAKRFRDDNQGSNVALNQDEEGSQLWEKVPQPDNELLKHAKADPSQYEGGTIEEQVANLMEKRSFSEDATGDGWAIYSRNTEYAGDGTWLKVVRAKQKHDTIPTINFDRTDENGQDAWEIRADDRPVGEVYVGFDTDEEPAQPYINSISVVEEYRHQGIGKQVVQLLADHYGSLTSDPGGNTTSEAHSMWRSVPGARQITVSPYGKEIQIWKIGGKLLEMSRTSQPASNEQKIRMRELLNRGYNHMEAAEMLGLVYTPTGKLVQKQARKRAGDPSRL